MSEKIREILAQEAAEAQTQRDDPPGIMHRARATGITSDVYTVRMPTDRLTELRELATAYGEQPSALMRRWVLERLDTEHAHQPDLDEVRRTLYHALDALNRIAGSPA